MSGFWTGLLANLAIVAAVISIWTNLRDYLPRLTLGSQALVFGAVMGLGTAASMLFPFQIESGLIVDMRTALLAVAAFFGGPLAAIVAGGLAIVCRTGIGGVGAASGSLAVGIVAAVGLAGQALVYRRIIREWHVILLALAATAGAVLSFAVLPSAAWVLMEQHLEPFVGVTLAATVLAGLAVLQDSRRHEYLQRDTIYRAIIEALPECLNVKDLDGRFIAANPATARLMRTERPSDLVGKTDFNFYPEEVAVAFRQDEASILAAGVPATIDQRVSFDDGTSIWLSTLKAPLRDDTGRIIGLITHNRDVTGQRALEEELRTTRQRLEDALEHMADGLVLYDREGTILLRNSQYLGLFPLTADLRVPGAPAGRRPPRGTDARRVATGAGCRYRRVDRGALPPEPGSRR